VTHRGGFARQSNRPFSGMFGEGGHDEGVTSRIRFQDEDEYVACFTILQYKYVELVRAMAREVAQFRAIIVGLESQLGYEHTTGLE
jgi:hypothetical protein